MQTMVLAPRLPRSKSLLTGACEPPLFRQVAGLSSDLLNVQRRHRKGSDHGAVRNNVVTAAVQCYDPTRRA
jgi:hypothetical protein